MSVAGGRADEIANNADVSASRTLWGSTDIDQGRIQTRLNAKGVSFFNRLDAGTTIIGARKVSAPAISR
jgi:hypothetical protein